MSSNASVPWLLVVLLGISAALVAVPSVFAFWVGEATALIVEPLAWVALYALIFVPLLVRARPERPILSGLLAGVASAFATIGVQGLLIQAYWEAHPSAAATYTGADALTVTRDFAATALGFGTVFGLLIGLAVWGLLRRKDRQDNAGDRTLAA